MRDDQPQFRFNPGAYGEGREFVRSRDRCDVCSHPCAWKYTGCIYAEGEVPTVCARCIASGELGRFLDRDFCLHDIEIDGAEARLEEELLQRTPGVSSFNAFDWPVLEGTPMAFVGYGEDEDLLAIRAVQSAIDTAFREIGQKYDGPTSYALIFKEVDGERYRAVVDLD